MDRIHIGAGLSFVTADRVAVAVIEYARRLAERGRFDVLEVPVVRDNGSRGMVTLMLGASTQIAAEALTATTQQTNEDEWVDTLEQEIAALRSGAIQSVADFDADLERLFDL